ncbi:uncharacterized protein LOC131805715 [Musca domestica]|uniref:Uncharacterized protein LOC131805715 n=1 Tax=Musca domestica TaxID=7370 RepID=A0ABM3VHG3_MUSDO|nr:uncharacterized protein LOC131805715 [Musca domestica]
MESVSCAKFEYEADNLLEECTKLRNMPEKDLSDSLIETKLESLDEDWQNLRSAFESVFFAGTEDEEDKQYKIKVKKYYESVRDNYQVTKATLLEILKNRKAQSQSNNARGEVTNPSLFHSSAVYPPGTTFDMSEICIKVPPCDTQDFYGSYEEWPTFRDMFTAIYGNHPRLTPAQKLYHLRNKTKATVESSKDIKRIQSTVSDCLAILRAHSVKVDQWDPILIYLCSTKLPVDTLTLWEQSLESHSELPKWSQMEDFLKNRHRVLERIDGLRSQTASTSFSNDHISHQNAHLTQSNRCVMCYKNHILKNCMRFNNMNVNQRIEFAREKRLCNNCLTSGHISQECVSVHRCMFCKKKHHTKLHLQSNGQERSIQPRNVTRDNQAPVRSANGSQTNTLVTTDNTVDEMPCSSSSIVQASNVETHVSVCHDDIMLPTALVKVKHAGEQFTVRALIGSASERTFITQKIVKRIGLCTEKANFKISGLSGTVVANSIKKCMLTLCSDTINNEIETEALIVQNLTSLLPTQIVSISDLGSIKELKLADPGFMISAQVDMLIGSDVIPQIILEGVKKNILGNMIAQNSIYGWYIYGPIKSNEICLASVEVEEHSEDDISSALKKFWEQEEVNNVPIATESDNYYNKQMVSDSMESASVIFLFVALPENDEEMMSDGEVEKEMLLAEIDMVVEAAKKTAPETLSSMEAPPSSLLRRQLVPPYSPEIHSQIA